MEVNSREYKQKQLKMFMKKEFKSQIKSWVK
jgi:hypothetical protein